MQHVKAAAAIMKSAVSYWHQCAIAPRGESAQLWQDRRHQRRRPRLHAEGESVAEAQLLGLSEQDVIFLGYPDGYCRSQHCDVT